MQYYMIKPQFDQKRRKDGSILIANELYTHREVSKFEIPQNSYTKVSIFKNKTYFCFGARFAVGAKR